MPQGIEVIGIAAQSIDGFIARDETQKSTDWTSKEDAAQFREATREAGALILGRKTFDTFGGRPLPRRWHFVLTSKPEEQTPYPMVQYLNTSPEMVLHEARTLGYKRVFVAGGASVYRLFLDAKLMDELWLTIEPIIFGDGIPMFQGLTIPTPKCELLSNMELNPDTVQLKYKLGYE